MCRLSSLGKEMQAFLGTRFVWERILVQPPLVRYPKVVPMATAPRFIQGVQIAKPGLSPKLSGTFEPALALAAG
jgi:hypothetical protein